MEKRRVLYIITKSIWGGATKYTCDLATTLPRDGFEVFAAAGPVPTDYSGRDLFSELRGKDIALHEIKNFQRSVNPLKDIFAFFEIVRLIRKVRPDIIHVSSSKAGGLVGLASFFLKTKNYQLKTIFTAHGWAYHEERPFWQRRLLKLASCATAAFYDTVICVSEYDRRSAIENKIAPATKLVAVHNGIAIDAPLLPRAEARRKLLPDIADGDFLFGAVGEYVKNKGYDILIDAAEIIIKHHPNAKFALLGHHGEEKGNLKSQILNLKLERSVFLVDNPSNARAHLPAFDIFVMPSLKEGLPYALLEAGAASLPVVASQVGGIPEIIEDGKEGLLVPPGNAAALAAAFEKMIGDETLRRNFGTALQKKIAQEFSFAKMLRETVAIY
ncbi:MAG: glycosyltransferase family 4 protein [Candidatus Niyogibacteria bacterium]|nr:glycosyltransferase family 4 protein [Candidatus Niyogibacteria bacterium]